MKRFVSQNITDGNNKVFGVGGTGDTLFTSMDSYTVHTIDLTGAGVATIAFNKGNGFNKTETLTAPDAASYFEPGTQSIRVTMAGGAGDVILFCSNTDQRP